MSDISEVGQEYSNAMKKLFMIEKKMLEQHPEIKDIFDEYQSAAIDLSSLSNRHEFAKGVRVGSQLIIEMMKPII